MLMTKLSLLHFHIKIQIGHQELGSLGAPKLKVTGGRRRREEVVTVIIVGVWIQIQASERKMRHVRFPIPLRTTTAGEEMTPRPTPRRL
jgi:hypothetical protein